MRRLITAATQTTAIILLGAFATPAFATCTPTDIGGVWMLNGFTQDPFSGENENLACKVKLGSAGAVLGGSSSCTARYKNSPNGSSRKGTVNVTGGKLTLNKFCKLTGTIRFSQGGVLTIDGGQTNDDVDIMSIVGVGEGPDRWHVVLNGIKK